MSSNLNVALVGAGAAAMLHVNGYRRVHSADITIHTICDTDHDRVDCFSRRTGIPHICYDFNELLKNDDIDIIDICTPPFLHKSMIIAGLKAGKHVVCEKPLAGYFGEPGDPDMIGIRVPKEKMYSSVCASIDELKGVIDSGKTRFMYAENFVYAPMVIKAGELLQKSKSKVAYSCGELYVRGSTSFVAGLWSKTGGGPLIRNGCHLISAVLKLKQQEAEARKESISIKSVNCDVGLSIPALTDDELRFISARPKDVEDFACVTITFSDTTKSVILVSDAVLGGNVNNIRLYANDCVIKCDLTPSTLLETYYVDGRGIEDIELNDRIPSNLGWEHADVSDEVLRGYANQFQDFAECASIGRQPKSNFEIAADTLKVIYAAYWSAETGRKINL